MLELRFIRENLPLVKEKSLHRGVDPQLFIDFDRVDGQRLRLLAENETLKNQRNQVSKKIALLKREGEGAAAEEKILEMRNVSQRIKELDQTLSEILSELDKIVLAIPNLCHDSVPVGHDESDNQEIKHWGHIPQFDFQAKPHWEVGEQLGILDFETAAQLSGARFVVLKGLGARLERALSNFMLDLHTQKHGYEEVLPPYLVNSTSLTGTGQLPKFADDLFKINDRDLWLIPTAEVPLTGLHADQTLEEASLPRQYVAHTPCFRSEAGSYGQDTRGLIRQHQFNKVELVKIAHPEHSEQALEHLLADAEQVLQLLQLPYRVVKLCTGDLGFSAGMTYDIEVWLPGQNTYREISSCSNFYDFQARRSGIRYRPEGNKKSRLAHTLNGSGLAVGRTMVALLENCQQADGTLKLPTALQPYMQSHF